MVEGYYAAATGMELAERMGIEMPITQAIYSVMYEDACVYSVSEGMMGGQDPRGQRQLVRQQNRTKRPLLCATEGVFSHFRCRKQKVTAKNTAKHRVMEAPVDDPT